MFPTIAACPSGHKLANTNFPVFFFFLFGLLASASVTVFVAVSFLTLRFDFSFVFSMCFGFGFRFGSFNFRFGFGFGFGSIWFRFLLRFRFWLRLRFRFRFRFRFGFRYGFGFGSLSVSARFGFGFGSCSVSVSSSVTHLFAVTLRKVYSVARLLCVRAVDLFGKCKKHILRPCTKSFVNSGGRGGGSGSVHRDFSTRNSKRRRFFFVNDNACASNLMRKILSQLTTTNLPKGGPYLAYSYCCRF